MWLQDAPKKEKAGTPSQERISPEAKDSKPEPAPKEDKKPEPKKESPPPPPKQESKAPPKSAPSQVSQNVWSACRIEHPCQA